MFPRNRQNCYKDCERNDVKYPKVKPPRYNVYATAERTPYLDEILFETVLSFRRRTSSSSRQSEHPLLVVLETSTAPFFRNDDEERFHSRGWPSPRNVETTRYRRQKKKIHLHRSFLFVYRLLLRHSVTNDRVVS